jgi:anti-anti-sigma factor
MELQFNLMENGIRLIKLIGRLDTRGASEIETKFASFCAGDDIRVIVDLADVDFLASSGIRLITQTERSVFKRCGKMALINPNPEIQNILEMTGIPETIPLYSQLESAETVLLPY